MIGFDEAVELVRKTARPTGTERIPLERAHRRVLAEPVIAQIDAPRTDVSAMDGYAVRESDLVELPARLRIAGRSYAGSGYGRGLSDGECVRIFTGAPVPPDADRVVIQENVRAEGDVAVFESALGPARHIRHAASDFACGDTLLEAGRVLDSRAIVAVAAADLSEVEVYRAPRVAILGTGDELVEPGRARESVDSIPESVSFGIAALAHSWGGKLVGRSRMGDDLGELERAAEAAVSQAELVVVTGGASVGEKDFAKRMFEPLGLELIFSKVAIKPGKPVWLGRAGQTLVIGLPGNPTSALVTGRLLLAPLVAGLCGRSIDEALRWRRLPLANELGGCGARETFHRAGRDGDRVQMLSNQDSSAQKSLAEADVLVRQVPNAPAQSAGSLVETLDF